MKNEPTKRTPELGPPGFLLVYVSISPDTEPAFRALLSVHGIDAVTESPRPGAMILLRGGSEPLHTQATLDEILRAMTEALAAEAAQQNGLGEG